MRRSILFIPERTNFVYILLLTLLVLIPVAVYQLLYKGLIYPNIFIAGVNVGEMTQQEASGKLAESIKTPVKITLKSGDKTFDIKAQDVDSTYDINTSVARAYNFVRTGNFFYDLQERFKLIDNKKDFGLVVAFNEDKLQKIISVISGQIAVDPTEPVVKISLGEIIVNPGEKGTEVNQLILRSEIGQSFSNLKSADIEIPLSPIDHTLTDAQVSYIKERGQKFIGKNIVINFEDHPFVLKDSDIISFLDPRGGLNNEAILSKIDEIEKATERDPQNSKFDFENGKVTEFLPALDGIKVDPPAVRNKIIDSINLIENSPDKSVSFDLPVIKTPPEITIDKVNNMGIKELIGRGTSTYYHSIPGRVHNVVLAASRINGTLVKPGDTFSFNQTLGDVSSFTGYQQAYIISDGKTILGDGGGVCQVSTTLFRAVLNAGLPVLDRTAHAYRVGYYEQNSPVGMDATVYGPTPDFKFKNDTNSYILIEAKADPRNYALKFELYGTSDGRIATVSKPVVTDISAPPPDVYQDDPTIPAGTIKQVDFKAWGAKVFFDYNVTKDGQTVYKKTFISNYRPWAAVFMKGTGPVI